MMYLVIILLLIVILAIIYIVSSRKKATSVPSLQTTQDKNADIDYDAIREQRDDLPRAEGKFGSLILEEPIPDSIIDNQIQSQISRPATTLHANNMYYVTYELFLNNAGMTPIDFRSLNIYSDLSDEKIIYKTYTGSEIIDIMREFKSPVAPPRDTILVPGMRYVLYITLSFKNKKDIPSYLQHEIVSQNITMKISNVKVNSSIGPTISPPVVGERWLATNGPSNDSVHRRTYFLANGRVYYPELYAVDWIKLDESGKNYTGSGIKNEDYFAYGQNIYSVLDGIVLETLDGIPDNTPNNKNINITASNIGGNYVLVKSDNYYIYYAHLIPGSIRVKIGDNIKSGDILGLLGNSGNSTTAHLHFHITDDANSLASNGLPYNYTSFIKYKDVKITDSGAIIGTETEKIKKQMVLENSIINFPGY